MGDLKVLDEGEEKFGLNWHGKKQARQIALTPSLGTLLPCPEESVYWDITQNMFIEGDNLEVLKLLQKSYANKVKMIYIDPPYNTGKEFVYPDKFQDNLDTYLKYTRQIDDEGVKFTSNTETGGRKHTNWLNMMYPRLKLAKNLLRQDGVIFISCDDNEQSNLISMYKEILGEEHFVGVFPWRSRTAKADVPFGISVDVEWVICFAKDKFIAGRSGNRKYYKSKDYADRWRLSDLTTNKTKDERPNSYFIMINPKTDDKYLSNENRTWAVTKDTFEGYYQKGKIVFPRDYNFLNIKRPAFRVFEAEDQAKALEKYGTEDVKMAISTYLPEKNVGRTEHGSKEIRELFDAQVFSYPKPTGLIKFFIDNSCDDDAIILDFFAGSATTADAVMQSNIKEKTNRKYIMVQLPESLDPTKKEQKTASDFCDSLKIPRNIAELAKERIRRAAKKIQKENPDYDGDLGFKVFKLASSNIKVWNPDRTDIAKSLEDHAEHLVKGRSEQDILYELLLKRGVDLTTPIETKQIVGKNIHSIGFGKIITCLDELITGDEVEELSAAIIEWQKEFKKATNIKGIPFEGSSSVLLKEQIAQFFDVTVRTVENYLAEFEPELTENGYVVLRGKRLKELKSAISEMDVPENTFGNINKAPKLGVFDFRAFLNMAMLMSDSEPAKILRQAILDYSYRYYKSTHWWRHKIY